MNGLLWLLLIGLIAGGLAGVLVKGGGVGILGAVSGGYLFGSAGIGGGELLGAIVVATLGTVT